MSEQVTVRVIRFRRATAAQWAATNPVLSLAEPGIETDTLKWKTGDGVSAWNDLGYMVAGCTSVNHGADGTVARPSGSWTSVVWTGSVEPVNAIDGDIWFVTS